MSHSFGHVPPENILKQQFEHKFFNTFINTMYSYYFWCVLFQLQDGLTLRGLSDTYKTKINILM